MDLFIPNTAQSIGEHRIKLKSTTHIGWEYADNLNALKKEISEVICQFSWNQNKSQLSQLWGNLNWREEKGHKKIFIKEIGALGRKASREVSNGAGSEKQIAKQFCP